MVSQSKRVLVCADNKCAIMAELDNLLGSRISLISQQDVRYDGVLFSINAKESAIVLRDGEFYRCDFDIVNITSSMLGNRRPQ